MVQDKFLRIVVIIALTAVVALPIYTVLFAYPAFIQMLTENSEDDAVRIATHLMNSHLSENITLDKSTLSDVFSKEAEIMKKDFSLMKLKIFAPSGETIYSTDPKDIGTINKERYFHEIVSRGNTYTKIVKKDSQSLEGQTVTADVVETYVPVIKSGEFAGAFEIYLDITGRKEKSDHLMSRSNTVLFIIAFCLLTAVMLSSMQANRSMTQHKSAEDKIIRQSRELETINAELSALYAVSSAISRTINLDEVLATVLDTVTQVKLFPVERKGGIFILEGEDMKLVSHLGHSEAFLELHNNMKVGTCLCGLAAQKGEIIISGNSDCDARHTIVYPEMKSHGHICIPLKTTNRLVGVLYLYLSVDHILDERTIHVLQSIGNQIGIAIENAGLYREMKLLSLQDPLTGVANRRLMDIVLEQNIAEAERYGRPFSAIMLDIDYFKKYNDTYGHIAGDATLLDIAKILLKEVRDGDLAVRYGGEEFLILLAETELAKAVSAAERIRQRIQDETTVTVSLGVSSYTQGMTKDTLLNKADTALYKAKQEGRNRVQTS